VKALNASLEEESSSPLTPTKSNTSKHNAYEHSIIAQKMPLIPDFSYSELSMKLASTEEDTEPTTKELETPDLEIKRTNSGVTVGRLNVAYQLPVRCFSTPSLPKEKWNETEPADAFGKVIGPFIASAVATATSIPSTTTTTPPAAFPSADDNTIVIESEADGTEKASFVGSTDSDATLLSGHIWKAKSSEGLLC
jgi:hypothetical protein